MSKFTPGPWHIKGPCGIDNDFAIVAGQHEIIAEAWGRTGEHTYPDAEANAHLIAAAPQMLEALEGVVKNLNPDDWFEKCQAAIAKAKGE